MKVDSIPDPLSQTIAFWVRLRDIVKQGKRTVLSTHDNVCSKQVEGEVNGYSIFFEILDNSEILFHVVYRGRKNTCEDYNIEITQSLNRWTHFAVVFKNLSGNITGSRYKMELALYINGELVDSVITSRRTQVRSLLFCHVARESAAGGCGSIWRFSLLWRYRIDCSG